MKHILFIITSTDKIGSNNNKTGYEFSEVADPYFEFTKAGYTVDFASINGDSPPEDGYDEDHKNSYLFRNSNGFRRLNFSHKLENVNAESYDAIFFPGGLGPMIDMVDNTVVKKIIAKVYESGKIVAAVCHGPAALLNVTLSNKKNLLDGKKVTSFTEEEEQRKGHHLGTVIPFLLDKALIKQGAIYCKEEPFCAKVVVDGNLITGQNPSSAKDVASAVIEKLS
ncbi:MAG TPA: type 1 glutamine amidotransferase domain-containing protein [Cyclobacteriaceae bacterium]|jgi:putative intracellular protease/amidase|nr:type 1 glutamine amidotransferase domain-containing protein [Cyclobacteriaceae bacterium]